MTKRIIFALAGCVLLASAAGAGNPKLAKCTGPARYANPYGTVLPSLPVPSDTAPPDGVPSAVAPAPAAPATGPAAVPATPGAATSPPPAAPQTGALLPHFPSC